MGTLSTLPATYDITYILERMKAAGVTNHYGYSIDEGQISLRYRAEDFDTVQEILDSYQVSYADEVLRPRMIEQAAAIRWDKQQVTTFNGAPLLCDQTTINLVDATRNSMIDAPESPQTCLWKLGPTTWVELNAQSLLEIGLTIRNHVQGCYNHEKNLQDRILSATTADDLMSIDINESWPT